MASEITVRVVGQPLPRITLEPTYGPANGAVPAVDGNLCTTFVRLAGEVRDLLFRGDAVGVVPVEPTITDIALIELAARHPGQVTVVRSSTWTESREGTDFELRFTDGAWAYDLRVQAKKMLPSTGLYPEFAPGSKRQNAIVQCSKLMRRAANAGALPLYLFYNAQAAVSWVGAGPFPSLRHGCSLASANVVDRALASSGPANFPNIRQVPWHYLVCYGLETQPLVGDFLSEIVDELFGIDDPDQRLGRLLHDTDDEQDLAWLNGELDEDLAYRVLIQLEE